MATNNSTVLFIYRTSIGLLTALSAYFLVDIHSMVKTSHDADIAQAKDLERHDTELVYLHKENESTKVFINEILAVLPDRIKVKTK